MKPLNILLAEDNQADILLVRNALAEHRIQHLLHVVNDGGAAIQYVLGIGTPGAAPCPDVMLLDLNLPVADGPEVLRHFRAHPP
ncbi:MAG TPA: response regulator, partial [Bryobacteraceae bacterium]|nr:response regulator [Bryobacteraceae bacterium]